jgi:hypothetical protein
MTDTEKMAKRAETLSNAINDAVALECLKHSYSDMEMYIAIRYYLARLQSVLGKERVAQLESYFRIVTMEDASC